MFTLDSFLQFLEKKDHLIKKHNTLTDEQKEEITNLLNKFPDKENKFDWNKLQDISYEDFMRVLSQTSKTQKKKLVKQGGLEGLTEGEDYVQAYEGFNVGKNKDAHVLGLIPLNYEASKLIASSHVGNCEGKWCTSYQKTSEYWNQYTQFENAILVYLFTDTEGSSFKKHALVIYPDLEEMTLYDEEDDQLLADDLNVYNIDPLPIFNKVMKIEAQLDIKPEENSKSL